MGIADDPMVAAANVAAKYERHLQNALETHGLSLIAWFVLSRLNERDGDNTTTLAARAAHERSAVVRSLEKLERKRLVRRSNHHSDRRHHIVHITPAGRAAIGRAAKSVERLRAQACAGLGPEDIGALREVLGRIDRNLER